MNNNNKKGFTLIELLIVISIIGILASIVLVSLNTAREKAQAAEAKSQIKSFISAVELARASSDKTLRQITGSGWSANGCPGGISLINMTGGCFPRWRQALQRVYAANGEVYVPSLERDPWGSPYVLDENEGEVASNPCRKDNIRSAGPDGVRSTADDIIVLIPFYLSQCS